MTEKGEQLRVRKICATVLGQLISHISDPKMLIDIFDILRAWAYDKNPEVRKACVIGFGQIYQSAACAVFPSCPGL